MIKYFQSTINYCWGTVARHKCTWLSLIDSCSGLVVPAIFSDSVQTFRVEVMYRLLVLGEENISSSLVLSRDLRKRYFWWERPFLSLPFDLCCALGVYGAVSTIDIISNGLRSKILPTPSHVRKTSCFAKIPTCSGWTYLQAVIQSETPSKSRSKFRAPSRLLSWTNETCEH